MTPTLHCSTSKTTQHTCKHVMPSWGVHSAISCRRLRPGYIITKVSYRRMVYGAILGQKSRQWSLNKNGCPSHGLKSIESNKRSPGRKRWGGQKARVKLMVSAEREPITGVWGQSPSGVQEQSPWSGVQGAKPPEVESILPLDHPKDGHNLPL